MSDTNNGNAELVPQKPQVILSQDEILQLVSTYKANTEASLAKLQQNADKLQEQLNEVQKMRLMVIGQSAVVTELINKLTVKEEKIEGKA